MEDSTVNDYAAGLTEDQSISRPMRLGILDDLLHSQGLIGDENTITFSEAMNGLHLQFLSSQTPLGPDWRNKNSKGSKAKPITQDGKGLIPWQNDNMIKDLSSRFKGRACRKLPRKQGPQSNIQGLLML
ncbi:hypothetical protein NC651_018091 [Populus alba x Populus x berolinensis]|nr:hypothetical protein NC651_018091 [Populus alba x Populus x berolinensis]